MKETKIITSRYEAPLQTEMNKLIREGWTLFSFDVMETPQGLLFVVCMVK